MDVGQEQLLVDLGSRPRVPDPEGPVGSARGDQAARRREEGGRQDVADVSDEDLENLAVRRIYQGQFAIGLRPAEQVPAVGREWRGLTFFEGSGN